MAFFKIVKLSELGKSWLPQDHIPESRLAELLELRNRRVEQIDARLKNLCKLDDEIYEIQRKAGEHAHTKADLGGGAEAIQDGPDP